MTPEQLKLLMDLGFGSVTLFLLFKVWERLNVVTDRMLTYLEAAARERHAMMRAQGIDTDDA